MLKIDGNGQFINAANGKITAGDLITEVTTFTNQGLMTVKSWRDLCKVLINPGKVVITHNAILKSQKLDNRQGQIKAGGSINVSVRDLTNTKGVIGGAAGTTVTASHHFDNENGTIESRENTRVVLPLYKFIRNETQAATLSLCC